MVSVIISHIYIGTIGMEGAFDAMGNGEVDLNWAREHHSLWLEEELRKGKVKGPAAERGSGGVVGDGASPRSINFTGSLLTPSSHMSTACQAGLFSAMWKCPDQARGR